MAANSERTNATANVGDAAPAGDAERDAASIIDALIQCAEVGRYDGKTIGAAKDWLSHHESRLAAVPAPVGRDAVDDSAPTREERIATLKALSALDALSEAWADDIDLDSMCAKLAHADDVPAAIRAMVVQAYVEGAYAGRTSHRDAAPTHPRDQVTSAWQPMETAPKDGTLLRLLVRFDEHPTEDAEEAPTIGHNNRDNDGEDVWAFAGWCWSHDHFTQGKGTPIGWLPVLNHAHDPQTGVDGKRPAARLQGGPRPNTEGA